MCWQKTGLHVLLYTWHSQGETLCSLVTSEVDRAKPHSQGFQNQRQAAGLFTHQPPMGHPTATSAEYKVLEGLTVQEKSDWDFPFQCPSAVPHLSLVFWDVLFQ